MRVLCDNGLRISHSDFIYRSVVILQQTGSSFTLTQKVAVAHYQSCPYISLFWGSTDDNSLFSEKWQSCRQFRLLHSILVYVQIIHTSFAKIFVLISEMVRDLRQCKYTGGGGGLHTSSNPLPARGLNWAIILISKVSFQAWTIRKTPRTGLSANTVIGLH